MLEMIMSYVYRVRDRTVHVLTVFEAHRLLRSEEVEDSESQV